MCLDCFKKIVELIVLLIGIPIGFYQLFLVIKQIKQSSLQVKKQNEWNMMNVTFQYIDSYTRDLKDINSKLFRELVNNNNDSKPLDDKILKNILNSPALRADIVRLVAYFDTLALGIMTSYYDEKISRESLVVVVIDTYKVIEPYILYRRKETNMNIASNFEKLYNKWK